MLQTDKYYPGKLITIIKKEPAVLLPVDKLRVDTGGQVYYFPINDIVRIQSVSNYSKIFFLLAKPMLVAKILKKFEEQLLETDFARIHRTHLINKHYLLSYNSGTAAKVFLINGDELPVARRRRKVLYEMGG
jgi:two-component system, LytTR family, response regulator